MTELTGKEIEVVDWISWLGSEKYPDSPLGGMGGWFNLDATRGGKRSGQRWKDYLDACSEESHPYAEAFRREVLRSWLTEGGDWHQNDPRGVPLFSDGTVASFSMRAWGDVMAAIWSEKMDKDYDYMNFYMSDWRVEERPEEPTICQ